MTNLEQIGKEEPWPILKNDPNLFLEGLKKNKKDTNHKSRSLASFKLGMSQMLVSHITTIPMSAGAG
jgi:hypothetical protein